MRGLLLPQLRFRGLQLSLQIIIPVCLYYTSIRGSNCSPDWPQCVNTALLEEHTGKSRARLCVFFVLNHPERVHTGWLHTLAKFAGMFLTILSNIGS